MKFSDETALGSRLAGALKKTEGTLTVSWLNFSEFATVTHRDQRLRAERLLDSVAPALFCLNSEPFQVHARQLRGDVMPHADEELAALFVSTQRTLTATGLFEPLNHPRLVKGKKTLARTIQERLEKLRQEWADNTSFRSEVARADRSPEARAATRTLAIWVQPPAATARRPGHRVSAAAGASQVPPPAPGRPTTRASAARSARMTRSSA